MPIEEVISTIISEYGSVLWLSFVTLVITGFVLTLIKDFISDLVAYFRARMSDVGYGQRIMWKGEILVVDCVKFKHIVAHDDRRKVLIPIKTFIDGIKEYPFHRHDDFDEQRYYERPWDGKTERRQSE